MEEKVEENIELSDSDGNKEESMDINIIKDEKEGKLEY